jgi:hypothetical protein
MRRFGGWAIVLACGLLAGCLSWRTKPEDPQTLSLACQLTPCTCRATTKSFWAREADTTTVQYRRDGGAFCPEGFRLERKNSS